MHQVGLGNFGCGVGGVSLGLINFYLGTGHVSVGLSEFCCRGWEIYFFWLGCCMIIRIASGLFG